MTAWVYDDGGRSVASGFGGTSDARDCVVRSIAIAGLRSYEMVYRDLALLNGGRPPRLGVPAKVWRKYLASWDWTWTPTMGIGTGCRVHLRADELPSGRLLVQTSRHLTAVVDGVIHDTHDPSRNGTRCVYGYARRMPS